MDGPPDTVKERMSGLPQFEVSLSKHLKLSSFSQPHDLAAGWIYSILLNRVVF